MLRTSISADVIYLSDAEWARIAPLLPPQRPRIGRPAHDHRRIVSGILWVQRTGGPWRQMPIRYGRWTTVASRYHRWKKAGVWQRVQAALHGNRSSTEEVQHEFRTR